MDPLILPIREQCPRGDFVCLYKYLSKTCMDKKMGRTPTGAGKTTQQKRHSTESTLKNGGVIARENAKFRV